MTAPEASSALLRFRVVSEGDPLPRIAWQWEPETDILSGAIERPRGGRTGTAELSEAEGAVAVLDLHDLEVRGLDIVVWPEVTTIPGLIAPLSSLSGRVVLVDDGPVDRAAFYQQESPLVVQVDARERVFHLRVGLSSAVTVVRVADHLAIEVDASQHLAGFWLTGVPAFPDEP